MAENNTPLLSQEEIADLLAPLDPEPAKTSPSPHTTQILLVSGSFSLSSEEIQALTVGAELPITPPASDEFDLYIEDRCIGQAKLVRKGNSTAMQLTKLSLPANSKS